MNLVDADTANALKAVYAGFSEPTQKAIEAAVTKLATAAAGSLFNRFWTRFTGSRDEQVRQLALRSAVAAALAGRSDLDAIGLTTVLRRQPFAGVITRVLQHPEEEVSAATVQGAFAESIYDLRSIGIDEVALVEDIRTRFLYELRTGPTGEAKLMYVGTRAEQTYQRVVRAEAVQEQILNILSAPVATHDFAEDTDDCGPWQARLDEAKALYEAGAVRSALRMWERLRDEVTSGNASPQLRAKIYNNTGAAFVELDCPGKAIEAFRMALDYVPESADYLANLAQAELVAGRRRNALRNADRALALDPKSRIGWSVRIQTSELPIDEDCIPQELREHPQILVASAIAAADTDHTAAIALLSMALRTGPREPQILIVLAEMLYSSLFPRRISESVSAEIVEEIARLGREATNALEATERNRMLARALVIQGAAADLARADDRGAGFFQRAVEADPSFERASFGAAQAQVLLGNGSAALHLLDQAHVDHRSASWHALRARALLAGTRAAELDGEVQAALDTLEPAENASVAQSLAETLLQSDRLDLIDPVLDLLERTGQYDFFHLFRARVAAQRGEQAEAEREYEAAVETVVPQARHEVEVEFAVYMYREGEYERAAGLFEGSGIWADDERIAAMYGRSLHQLGQWDRLAVLLEELRPTGDLPDWGVDLESRLALYRDDVPGALASLEQLARQYPDDAEVRIRFAHTLIRAGYNARAAEILRLLENRADLDAEDTTNLAQLLIEVNRPGPALTQAYRAIRQYPDDPNVQAACIANVFFRAEGARAAPEELFVRSEVVPDTWIRLRAADGEELYYLILSDGPLDVRRNELLAGDSRAQALLGLKENDTVRLRLGAANEKEFRVVELKSALLHVFHDAMLGYQARFPGRLDMQMVRVGEGDSFDPWPFYRMVLHSQEGSRGALDLYRDKRLPIGVLAEGQHRSVRRTYLQLLYDPDMPVYVEEPSAKGTEESFAEARKKTVVLTATGLATLQVLNLLDLIPKLYDRLFVPQSLVDELNEELAQWEEAHAHGGYTTARVSDDHLFNFDEITPDHIGAVQRRTAELRDWVLGVTRVMPRPLTSYNAEREKVRTALGASSYDAYVLAGGEIGLHADDWGLRNLARADKGIGGFSTFALLRVAAERALLSGDEMRRHIGQLVGFRHTFVPVDVALLYQEIVENGFEIDNTVLRLLDVLADPAVTEESALHVAVGLIRELALSPLGHGAVGVVTAVVLDRVTTGRDFLRIVRFFIAETDTALRLLPQTRATVHERVNTFLAAKAASRAQLHPIIHFQESRDP